LRTFELRVYTLPTKEALDFYRRVVYPRHLNSFPLFGIQAHGFWIAKADTQPRLFALVSYAAARRTRRGRSAVYAKHGIRRRHQRL